VDLDRLDATLAAAGEPAYRARQIWRWAASGAGGYDEMTDLPVALRRRLDDAVPFSSLEVETESRARDGTVKALFRTVDGHPVEAVVMPFRDGRRSVCVSSQSGCPLTCTFCATGAMRFGRNLTASEIVDQALYFRRSGPLSHCVFMGMGEPMMNLDAVLAAATRLPDLGITHRRTTVSTVGWIPGLERFVATVETPIRLALSIHAPDDALRSELMPVNDRYPLSAVLELGRAFHRRRRLRVFVEYVLLAGINDRVEQAAMLADRLDPTVFKVNLIPYNPTGGFTGSSRKSIAAFKALLERRGIPATVRLTRGRDIDAACGQLASAPRQAAARSSGGKHSRIQATSSGFSQ
jgi:23S rRNA (adenine2503-C2)-methyltransferase